MRRIRARLAMVVDRSGTGWSRWWRAFGAVVVGVTVCGAIGLGTAGPAIAQDPMMQQFPTTYIGGPGGVKVEVDPRFIFNPPPNVADQMHQEVVGQRRPIYKTITPALRGRVYGAGPIAAAPLPGRRPGDQAAMAQGVSAGVSAGVRAGTVPSPTRPSIPATAASTSPRPPAPPSVPSSTRSTTLASAPPPPPKPAPPASSSTSSSAKPAGTSDGMSASKETTTTTSGSIAPPAPPAPSDVAPASASGSASASQPAPAPQPASQASSQATAAAVPSASSQASSAVPAASSSAASSGTGDRTQVAARTPEPSQTSPKPPAASASGVVAVSIEFPAGESEIPSGGESKLDQIVAELDADPNRRLQLLAYASPNGESASRARRLSLSRALAVRSYLMSKGVRSTRMDVRALGDQRDGGSADRVDIEVTSR